MASRVSFDSSLVSFRSRSHGAGRMRWRRDYGARLRLLGRLHWYGPRQRPTETETRDPITRHSDLVWAQTPHRVATEYDTRRALITMGYTQQSCNLAPAPLPLLYTLSLYPSGLPLLRAHPRHDLCAPQVRSLNHSNDARNPWASHAQCRR